MLQPLIGADLHLSGQALAACVDGSTHHGREPRVDERLATDHNEDSGALGVAPGFPHAVELTSGHLCASRRTSVIRIPPDGLVFQDVQGLRVEQVGLSVQQDPISYLLFVQRPATEERVENSFDDRRPRLGSRHTIQLCQNFFGQCDRCLHFHTTMILPTIDRQQRCGGRAVVSRPHPPNHRPSYEPVHNARRSTRA